MVENCMKPVYLLYERDLKNASKVNVNIGNERASLGRYLQTYLVKYANSVIRHWCFSQYGMTRCTYDTQVRVEFPVLKRIRLSLRDESWLLSGSSHNANRLRV